MGWLIKYLKEAALAALSAAASKFVGTLSSKFLKIVIFLVAVIFLGIFIF